MLYVWYEEEAYKTDYDEVAATQWQERLWRMVSPSVKEILSHEKEEWLEVSSRKQEFRFLISLAIAHDDTDFQTATWRLLIDPGY